MFSQCPSTNHFTVPSCSPPSPAWLRYPHCSANVQLSSGIRKLRCTIRSSKGNLFLRPLLPSNAHSQLQPCIDSGRCAYNLRHHTRFRYYSILLGRAADICEPILVRAFHISSSGVLLLILCHSIFYLLLFTMSITMKAWFRGMAAAFKSEATAQAVSGIFHRHFQRVWVLTRVQNFSRYNFAWYGHIYVRFMPLYQLCLIDDRIVVIPFPNHL